MMRQRVGSKRCRLPYTHTNTHIHACRRTEPSQVLYRVTGASLEQWERGEERAGGEMNLLWLLRWTQLFNTTLLFPSSSALLLSTIFCLFLWSPFFFYTTILPPRLCVYLLYYPDTDTDPGQWQKLRKTGRGKKDNVNERAVLELGKWGGKKEMERDELIEGKRLNRWIWFIYNEISLRLYRGMCSIQPFCCYRQISPFNILKISGRRYTPTVC